MSGKGSGRRPAAISASEADANWARTFGKADSERCKGAPRDQNAETIPRVLNGGRGPQTGDVANATFTAALWEPIERAALHGAIERANREVYEMFHGAVEPISPTEGA